MFGHKIKCPLFYEVILCEKSAYHIFTIFFSCNSFFCLVVFNGKKMSRTKKMRILFYCITGNKLG